MIQSATPTAQLEKPRGVKTFSEPKLRVFERDGFVCQYCGVDLLRDASTLTQATVDHVVPRSKGGSDHPENLVTACSTCNHIKNDYHAETVEDGKAYVTMMRAAFLGYFARTVQFHDITLPKRDADAGESFRTDLACALGQFANRVAKLITSMLEFKGDVDRVLTAVDLTETMVSNASSKPTAEPELPEEDTMLDIAEILKASEAIVSGKKKRPAPAFRVGLSRPTPEMVDRAEALLQAGYEPQEVSLETGMRINLVELLARELEGSTARL